MEKKTLLRQGIDGLGIEVSQKQEECLSLFLSNVLLENKKFNLTGIRDPREAIIKHLLDSLSLINNVEGNTIVDVGSGAGFPGIPLAIAQPKHNFVLIESKKKKAQFILESSHALGLDNILVFDRRSEDVSLPHGADAIVSRALGTLNYFIEKTKHMLAKNGKLYAMKGKNPEEEINNLTKGWVAAQIKKIDVPYLDAERHIITITKEK
ncbi:MAG: 16S rRNA (guanine(527)-N(7))-methyltransferase RsmG [Bacteroidetes bacterium]|nr:16S rRNA (guanine(527)-N(7))-methyltransferase RsmG [Bacteroidota bacterium]